MAIMPRPVRRFFRRLSGKSSSSANPNAVNPQTVGMYSRGSTIYLPTPVLIALLVFGAAIAGAQVWRAMHANDASTQIAAPGTIGSLHSVFTVGNLVFVGTLESVDHGSVVLSDVFYFQGQGGQSPTPTTSAQQGPARGVQLVRRSDSDWHQPTHMSIPIERVLLLETVGRDSMVGRLITEARARQQTQQPAPAAR